MKLPAYPRYKPSGVDWLGDVPEHWRTLRLKWIGESITGLTYSPTDIVPENEGTLVLRSTNIQDGRIILDDNVFVNADIPRKLLTRENDILICSRNGSRALVGKSGKLSSREAGFTFGAFTTVFRSSFNNYAFYIFKSDLFSCQAGLYQTSTIHQLTIGTLNSFQVPFPPLDEQKAIAEFLDQETGRIDQLMKKKRQLVERLKEKRTALISRTVTRGLPSAAARAAGLPENPLLKPSGFDWLGDIPANWDMKPLKYAVRVERGKFTHRPRNDPSMYDGSYPFIQTGDITATSRYITNYSQTLSEEGRAVSKMFPSQTIVMTIAANIGDIAILGFDAWFPDSIVGLIPKAETNFEFLFYLAISLRPTFLRFATINTQLNINNEQIGGIAIALPPLAEQAAIASYLDAETAKLDALMAKVEEAIERLQEYRTALITAAVTGKIDVRKEGA